jgi:hypothetical protein
MSEKGKCGLFKNPKLMTDKEIVMSMEALAKRRRKLDRQLVKLYNENEKRKGDAIIQKLRDEKIDQRRKQRQKEYDERIRKIR